MATSDLARMLLRNEPRFGPAAALYYLNPPHDLDAASAEARAFTQDYSAWRSLTARGLDARFGAFPERTAPGDTVYVLCMPRERALLELWLRWAAAQVSSGDRFWILGENRAGARSCGGLLDRYFNDSQKRDTARHCVLYEAADPAACDPFSEAEAFLDWQETVGSCTLELSSLPGVFAHGRIDAGTRMLLEATKTIDLDGRVLDFACGNGVVAAALKRLRPDLQVLAVDSNGLALAAARRTFKRNEIEVELGPSDGFSDVRGRFDAVITNPPFHEGVTTDRELSRRLLGGIRNFLRPGGQLLLVANRHLPYRRWIEAGLGPSDILAQDGRYQVFRAVH